MSRGEGNKFIGESHGGDLYIDGLVVYNGSTSIVIGGMPSHSFIY